jgi:hypothetical protein
MSKRGDRLMDERIRVLIERRVRPLEEQLALSNELLFTVLALLPEQGRGGRAKGLVGRIRSYANGESRPTGRPRIISDSLIKRAQGMIADGATLVSTAKKLGVGRTQLSKRLKELLPETPRS